MGLLRAFRDLGGLCRWYHGFLLVLEQGLANLLTRLSRIVVLAVLPPAVPSISSSSELTLLMSRSIAQEFVEMVIARLHEARHSMHKRAGRHTVLLALETHAAAGAAVHHGRDVRVHFSRPTGLHH